MTVKQAFPDSFGRDGNFPWMCRWDNLEVVVWAPTIEEARLGARQQAGPTVAVAARLATHSEVAASDAEEHTQ